MSGVGRPERIQRKLDGLPSAPGVYVFEDRAGSVLYIGKACSLRSRVRSYFAARPNDQRPFIALLAAELGDLTTYVVANEKEAALLENELIKEHQPRYNVKLRDDKDFLSIRVDARAPWPRLSVVRRPKADGARYYGPIDSATSARQTLRQINRFFQLRTCKDSEFKGRVRPCLQYQIKRCPAPCVKDVDREAYGAQVDLVGLFLDGRHETLVEDLEQRMRKAALDLRFEEAAIYRDQLRAVGRVRTRQRIATVKEIDQDVVGMYRAGDQVEIGLLRVRGGHLNAVRTFALDKATLPDDELISSFVSEYYRVAGQIPDEVLLPLDIEAREGLAGWLSDERGRRTSVLVPQRGAKRRLVEMAAENAEHAYKEKARAKEDLESRLGSLQKKLRIGTLPRRIECLDVSHHGGRDTVAAITAITNGVLDKTRYRSFKVKRASGGDDYGAMYEVLARRFVRGRDGKEGWELPDLFVVDGGKGQLNVALAVLKDFAIDGVNVVGLAKERREDGETTQVERVFLPGQKNAIPLPARSASRHLLTLVRDEAHRRSNDLRKSVGKKRRLASRLDELPGIGPKTKARLLTRLGSVRAIETASLDELIRAGANRTQAATIVRCLGGMPVGGDAADAERAALENAFEGGVFEQVSGQETRASEST